MVVFPNAKINLGLYVTGRRSDGYHNIETILYPVNLYDILEAVPSGGKAELHLTGRNLPGKKEDNIVWKAWQLMREHYDIPPVSFHLHKVIPSGAGLGGGSSDAAFTLCLLRDLFNMPVNLPELLSLAARLGSDCPFFVKNEPSRAAGRGELLTKASISLQGYYGLLYMPEVEISTKEAYQEVTMTLPPREYKTLSGRSAGGWKEWLSNGFEPYVFNLHPEIRKIKEGLYKSGAVYSSLTGSGSAVYAIFREEPQDTPVFPGAQLIWSGPFD